MNLLLLETGDGILLEDGTGDLRLEGNDDTGGTGGGAGTVTPTLACLVDEADHTQKAATWAGSYDVDTQQIGLIDEDVQP